MQIAALYPRVSTDRQAEKDESIPAQIAAMRKYADAKKMTVIEDFIFEEKGVTATTDKRPAFQRMMALSAKKPAPFQFVICWKFNRFARDEDDSVIYKALLKKNGVRVVSVNEDVPDDSYGWLMERMIEMQDANFSRSLSEHTILALHAIALRGYWANNLVPYGYSIQPIQEGAKTYKKLVVDEDQATIVRQIFRLSTQNYSARKIKPELPVTLTVAHINAILRNRHYTGTRVIQPKKSKFYDSDDPSLVVPNAHEAIIDETLFARTQHCLHSRIKTQNTGKIGTHLFTGLIFCRCGNRMIHKPMAARPGKQSKPTNYYMCAKQKSCTQKGVNEQRILTLLLDSLDASIFNEHVLEQVVTEAESIRTSRNVAKARDYILAELDEVRLRRERLVDQIELGVLTDEMIQERMSELSAKIAELEAKLTFATEDDHPINLKSARAFVRTVKRDLASNDKMRRQNAMRSIVSKIEWNHPTLTVHTSVMGIEEELALPYIERPIVPTTLEGVNKDRLIGWVRSIRTYLDDGSFPSREVSKWSIDKLRNYIAAYRQQMHIDTARSEE